MKIIVTYISRTGFTRRYAEWIAQALGCQAVDFLDIGQSELADYDVVIYGGRVHAGRIDGLSRIKKLTEGKSCRLVVFATGATPNAAAEEIQKLRQNNFPDGSTPFFYMQSGLCYERMGRVDKAVMKALAKMLAGKKDKTDAENGTALAISGSHDISDRALIYPLVEYVKRLNV